MFWYNHSFAQICLMIETVLQVSDLVTGPFFFLYFTDLYFSLTVFDLEACYSLWLLIHVLNLTCDLNQAFHVLCHLLHFSNFITFVSTPNQEQSRGCYASLSMYPFISYYISLTQDYFIQRKLKWYVWRHNEVVWLNAKIT